MEGVEREPAPDVLAWGLDQWSVNLKVRWWTDSRNVLAVRSRVIETVKRALDEAGVTIPFPTRVVLLQDPAARQEALELASGDRGRAGPGRPTRFGSSVR